MLKRCQIDPWGGEGEADSRVGSGGPVPKKTSQPRLERKHLHWSSCPPFFMKGRPTQKTTHPNKNSLHRQFAQTISGQFVQTVPIFPKNKQKTDKRVCANSLCKLFLFGWVFFFGGGGSSLPLIFFKQKSHQNRKDSLSLLESKPRL